MEKYLEIQNALIKYAQEHLVANKEHDRVDAVTFNGKEFIVFANTHASSYPQNTTYINKGDNGFKDLSNILDSYLK